nr:filamentous hemagglutinin N-terminal domain-containing protein [Burkholderia cenocepacia]
MVNNSPVIVNTQQAGFINGNPNFGPNDAARIIVNQVNSPNVTQIRGAIEIAGSKAQLVIANPSGVYLDGAGFINTSRAVITSGVPFYGPDGSLAGYNVSKGLVTVAGSGLNAANVDAVDILARRTGQCRHLREKSARRDRPESGQSRYAGGDADSGRRSCPDGGSGCRSTRRNVRR